MNKKSYTKEQLEYFFQHLSEILPEYFRLHSKLLSIADHTTREIDCSLNELAKALDYNCYALFAHLSCLADLKLIKCPRIRDFNKKIKIRVVVQY